MCKSSIIRSDGYCLQDKRITGDGELSDSEDEGEGGRRDNRSYRNPQPRKRPRLDKDSAQLKDEVKSDYSTIF